MNITTEERSRIFTGERIEIVNPIHISSVSIGQIKSHGGGVWDATFTSGHEVGESSQIGEWERLEIIAIRAEQIASAWFWVYTVELAKWEGVYHVAE